jgi:hypothetical protein
MSTRISIVLAIGGLMLTFQSAPGLAQGGRATCQSACDARCQSSRLSHGECMMQCTRRCKANLRQRKG